MDNRVIVITIIVVVAAVCVLVGYFAIRHVKRNTELGGEPRREKASAFIQAVRDTNWYENERPQMEFELLIFPLNGPPQDVKTRQVVSFSFLTVLKPGKYVDVTYDAGTFKKAYIERLKRFEVSGEPFDMKYFDDMSETLKSNSKLTEGTVVSLEETGSFVDSIPIYRVTAKFKTADGAETEGETFRVCRPWMLEWLRSGKPVKIVYSELDSSLFSIIE